jgi:hypothetical protein
MAFQRKIGLTTMDEQNTRHSSTRARLCETLPNKLPIRSHLLDCCASPCKSAISIPIHAFQRALFPRTGPSYVAVALHSR